MDNYFDENRFYEDKGMYNSEFSFVNKKRKIIITIITVIFLSFFVFIIYSVFFKEKYNYYLSVSAPEVVYVGDNANLSVNVVGTEKYKDRLSTSIYLSSETDALSLSEYEFYGDTGLITINPLISGEETINVVSTVDSLHNEGGTVVCDKKIPIIICPKFDSSLINTQFISVSKNGKYNLSLNFENAKCGEGITYTSGNRKIMDVSSDGVITGIKKGKANLFVSKDNKKFSVIVNVY